MFESRLRVTLRHSPAGSPTSGAEGEADEIGGKADIADGMSAVGGKPDVARRWSELLLLAEGVEEVL